MAGLTQEQQSNNRFTLESVLEEEDVQEEAVEERKEIHKNSETIKSLPFDKCIAKQTMRLMNWKRRKRCARN